MICFEKLRNVLKMWKLIKNAKKKIENYKTANIFQDSLQYYRKSLQILKFDRNPSKSAKS